MKELLLTTIFIGNLTITAYRSIRSQTDNSPYRTSINERTNVRGCAVSQDMLAKNGGPIHYGDLLYVDGLGFKFVNDTMNPKMTNHIDIWVETKEQEKAFFKKWHNGKTTVWIVRK